MIEKANKAAPLTKEEKEAAKIEKKRLADLKKTESTTPTPDDQVDANGKVVLTEDEELTIAEARAIIAKDKLAKKDGPSARVFNGQTTYAIFTEAQYGAGYQEIAKKFAKEKQFSVEFI